MNITKLKSTWLRHEPAFLAGLLFGCGVIIGAALDRLQHMMGKF
jgi:hypothetical protein